MTLDLRYYPDEVLRAVAEPVTAIDDDLRALVPELFAKMYATRGVGLAAPQVGISRRIIVSNQTGDPEQKQFEEVYLNPRIVDQEGAVRGEEGCLSLPGIVGRILRSQKVTVTYLDLEGNEQTVTAEEWKARIFQHEIDHIDGILILDKMSPAELAFYKKEIEELEDPDAAPEDRPVSEHSSAAL